MESQRNFLFIALLLLSVLVYQQWQEDYGPKPVTPATETTQTGAIPVDDSVPTSNNSDVPVIQSASTVPSNTERFVTIKAENIDVIIDTKGGDIVSAKLPEYTLETGSTEPFVILDKTNNWQHIAQSGLIGPHGPDASNKGRPQYQVAQKEYSIQPGETLEVPLNWQDENGLTITKVFTFTSGQYDIDVTYLIQNNSGEIRSVRPYTQLKQTMTENESSMMMPTYTGGAYSTSEEIYEKYSFEDMTDDNLRKTTLGGWASMIQHYFLAAWVPPANEQNEIYSRIVSGGNAIIGVKGPQTNIQPGELAKVSNVFYVGPKDQDALEALSPTLDLTVDYGPLWMVSQGLFYILKKLHELVGNWGVAIILITIAVKILMYPLTKKQYVSMAKLRNLQPKIQQLKDRFGDDRQKMGQAMMELYRKEKVNPMGGCLPILIQMPIFLALYWMFMESVELRQAPFFLWIEDLSVKDPYFVLPVLYGASMFLMQKLQPNTITDPMQQKIMLWMPVAFSILFVVFPAGLVLYWVVNNLISIIQMLMVYKDMEKKGIMTKKAKS